MDLPTFSTILDLMIWVCWSILSMTPEDMINQAFSRVIPDLQAMETLLNSSFSFAPGLLAVMQATNPPSISFLKNLPLQVGKIWAIYVLVLEKAGERSKIYVGSATHTVGGINARLGGYRRRDCLPRFVEKALKDGFTITHTGLLCWTPIPLASDVTHLRTLMLILEAAFTLWFGACYTAKIESRISQLRPWTRDLIQWDGLCSHYSITEGPGDLVSTLSPDEMNALAAERNKRNWQKQRETRGEERLKADMTRHIAVGIPRITPLCALISSSPIESP